MTKFLAILILIVSSFLTLLTESTHTMDQSSCLPSGNFTPNSTYEANLNGLLKSLLSQANASKGFYNTSTGKPSYADTVYGSFLCRGDITSEVCLEFVTDGIVGIKKKCPAAKASVLWYDQGMLMYSDHNTISAKGKEALLIGYNNENVTVTEPAEFMNLLNETLKQLITPAAERGYATREASFEKSRGTTLYTFAQCWPYLSASLCEDCLRDAISILLTNETGKIGGTILLPTCFARFESYVLYGAEKGSHSSSRLVIGIVSATVAVTLLCFVLWFTLKREKKEGNNIEEDRIEFLANGYTVGSEISELNSLQFDVGTIEAATDYFSNHNNLGEGGFGPVYKGTLPCGKKIAVKRLSQCSKQGVEEFENEVELIAKLQHRNLVRLLRFSMEREETILVYEYVPNGSLDQLLFEPQQSMELDWSTRHKIMIGVACGLLYLHEDSRLRVIHRDLKASNILLDESMNPKISDFGIARNLGAEQSQGATNKIVGTFGYMSPEYVMFGQFSVKSDIFSFGVLMLEIINGSKNQFFYASDHFPSLLNYVWEHWRIEALVQIVDPTLSESYSARELTRCIHIGLLCVQNNDEARPTIDMVLLMLSSADISLPMPEQPAFFIPSVKHTQSSPHQNSDRSSDTLNSTKIMPHSPASGDYLTDVPL